MEYETIQRNNDFLYKTLEFDQAERVEMERMAREAEAEEERKKDRRKSKLAKGRNWSKSKSPSRKKSSIKPVPEEIAQISSIVEDQTPNPALTKLIKINFKHQCINLLTFSLKPTSFHALSLLRLSLQVSLVFSYQT